MSTLTTNPLHEDALIDGIADTAGRDRAEEIRRAIRARYVTPQAIDLVMNMMLREAWRLDHDGDTAEWDYAAKATGLDLTQFERLTPEAS